MKIKNAEKLAALCLAAVMGVSVTACSGGNMYATSNESATIADNDVITIGSVTPNSGAAAAYGEAEVNGFKLAGQGNQRRWGNLRQTDQTGIHGRQG